MRTKVMIILSGIAAILLVRNLFQILLVLPDEAQQGAIYRIIFFHVPAAWTAFVGFFAAMVASILYLARKDLKYDSFAAAVTEVGLAFGAVNLITGMIWGRIIWGIWWTWDPRLTSMLVGWLIYAGYMMLRRAIEEPTERAKISAVLSIFAFADVPIIFFSIRWWRTQHPQPVIGGGGSMDPAMLAMLFLNWVPLLLLAVVLVMVRMRQEQAQREIDALRRYAHAF
ncbi:MAG TPA: cytochrome c biogenesis protein CcsA [Bryobacteraceae bacterium]|nr:cytochrome c biogenesis protein CcsA [Bryobacteraceae bacterium]